ERGAELLAQLELLWPGCSAEQAGDALRAAWPQDPWALGSYSCYRPGQWTGIGGAEAEPVRTLFFAGEHTSAVFQGYMNGAAESGAAAAADVLGWASGAARRTRRVRAGRRRALTPGGAR
ncbi:MAG: FAD-dependent oxidoreductase, partial [Myxococcota bacterium]